MNEPLQLVQKEDGAQQLMRRATDVAGVCREIVIKTACNIQGKKYVKAEGWMAIATAHGCIASSRDVEKIEGGWRAIGEIKRVHDGMVLSTAEGFVGTDETKTWAQRPEYACRAMAQTRAISRACRAAFAHVVVLMDAGLSTTPAEEVPDGGFNDNAPVPPVQKPTPTIYVSKQVAPSENGAIWKNVVVPKFIKKYAGLTLGEMADKDLIWWAENYQPKPFKGAISQADSDFRAALDAALADLKDSKQDGSPVENDQEDNSDVPF